MEIFSWIWLYNVTISRIVSMIPISRKEPDKISIAAFADSNLHWNDNLISSEFPFMWISRTSIDMW